ncbi:hypothetical protein HYFRA_00011244 [Hymenoscyphus fraxineus]|uniref:Uncharacterized protein n=1 Tax=Hymenoscyphus fraxineus TaxID=746836 RepID=A0A9N9L0B3_9HELO|nr:hypothetical protein HYFRA_00011244 [Hymenoscyphus fraxineus]
MGVPNFKTDFCIWDNSVLIYGPFTPWPKSIVGMIDGPPNDNMACWYYADCIFQLIPETRKQQHQATSLVMGLIPLVLKDIAWPHRRIAHIPHLLPWYTEIIVRALGLNPVVKRRRKISYGRTFNSFTSHVILYSLIFVLVGMYAILIIIEVYSKRSSLGCPVPIFIVAWFIVGLIPSAVEVAASRSRRRSEHSNTSPMGSRSEAGAVEALVLDSTRAIGLKVTNQEAVQGSGEALFVQIGWASYYTAGTLVFSSIMLVSVSELCAWLLATSATAAVSKMFAYKLCGYWGLGF